MYCPKCTDEFRTGFTRCEACGVDLVEDLSRVVDEAPQRPEPPGPLRLVEYCGFFTLDDARAARDRLRAEAISTDIVVREPPDADLDAPAVEEFWLRTDASRLREVVVLLDGAPEIEPSTSEGEFACSECQKPVPMEADTCPNCGAQFED